MTPISRATSMLAMAVAATALLGGAACERGAASTASRQAAERVQPAGEVVYAASNQIRALDAETGRELAAIKFNRLVRDMRFTHDGQRAFVGTSDGTWIVDAVEHKALTRVGQGPVGAVLRTPADREHLQVVTASLTPRWSLVAHDGQVAAERTLGERLHAVATSPAGDTLYTYRAHTGVLAAHAQDGTPRWETRLKEMKIAGELTPFLGVSPDGSRLYVPISGLRAGVVMVQAATGQATVTQLHLPASLRHVVPLADGRRLVINALSKVMILDLPSGKAEIIDVKHPFQGMAVTPDGTRAYVAIPIYNSGGAVGVIDLVAKKVVRYLETPEISPFTVAVRPAGR
jgi:DNA-binding beta-propeller fold protein YncE